MQYAHALQNVSRADEHEAFMNFSHKKDEIREYLDPTAYDKR